MKKIPNMAALVTALVIALSLLNCSPQDGQAAADASQAATTQPELSPKKEAPPTSSGCCFTQESDYAPYIPAGDDMLTPHGKKAYASNFFCGPDEDNKRSSATATYQIDKAGTKDPMYAKYLSIQIMDYCAHPEKLKAEMERRSTNDKKFTAENPNVTVTEFQGGAAYGFRYTDTTKGNNSQNVHLWASVGDRFRIHISGIDHVRMDMVDRLYAMIPIAQLAEVR